MEPNELMDQVISLHSKLKEAAETASKIEVAMRSKPFTVGTAARSLMQEIDTVIMHTNLLGHHAKFYKEHVNDQYEEN